MTTKAFRLTKARIGKGILSRELLVFYNKLEAVKRIVEGYRQVYGSEAEQKIKEALKRIRSIGTPRRTGG